MSTIEEIESAIEHLPQEKIRELSMWFDAYKERLFDSRIEADAKRGALDFLIEEAEAERKEGTLRRFP